MSDAEPTGARPRWIGVESATQREIDAVRSYARRQHFSRTECGCGCPACVRGVHEAREAGQPWRSWMGPSPCRSASRSTRG